MSLSEYAPASYIDLFLVGYLLLRLYSPCSDARHTNDHREHFFLSVCSVFPFRLCILLYLARQLDACVFVLQFSPLLLCPTVTHCLAWRLVLCLVTRTAVCLYMFMLHCLRAQFVLALLVSIMLVFVRFAFMLLPLLSSPLLSCPVLSCPLLGCPLPRSLPCSLYHVLPLSCVHACASTWRLYMDHDVARYSSNL